MQESLINNSSHYIQCNNTGYINASVIPFEQSVEVTRRTSFACVAVGYQSEYFEYRWQLNGTEIFGANNNTLDISSAEGTQAGVYECIVTNPWNDTSISAPAQLTVTSMYVCSQPVTFKLSSHRPVSITLNACVCMVESGKTMSTYSFRILTK